MRRWVAAPAWLVLLVACRGGDPASAPASSTTAAPGSITTATAATTEASTPQAAWPVNPPPGSVSLSVAAVGLGSSAAGSLRVLPDAVSNVTVTLGPGRAGAREAEAEPLEACPVTGLDGVADVSRCRPTGRGQSVELKLGSSGDGVEIRTQSRSSPAVTMTVDVAFTYVPASRMVTLRIPSLSSGGETRVAMVPVDSGAFRLEAHPSAGRPRLSLETGSGLGSRVLATVEGGTDLSINASVNGSREATLVCRNQNPDVVTGLRIDTVWP